MTELFDVLITYSGAMAVGYLAGMWITGRSAFLAKLTVVVWFAAHVGNLFLLVLT